MTNPNEDKSFDILGVKPIGESIKIGTEAIVSGAAAFLSRICLPVAEEFGFLCQDRVRQWRAQNLTSVLTKAEQKTQGSASSQDMRAHPRIVSMVLEQASWQDDEEVQELWAGLLAASCEIGQSTDANLIFVQLLSQMTPVQAKIIEYGCANSTMHIASSGLIKVASLRIQLSTLIKISGIDDIHRLDLELDHLRSLELISYGFEIDSITTADIRPTPLAVHLLAKCKGCRESGVEHFQIQPEPLKIKTL